MKTSIEGKIELLGHEGICLKPYLDSVNVWTIGGGATKSEIPGLNGSHRELTIKEVLDLFDVSLVKYENAVNKALKVEITQKQFDALVSICYNIGTGGLVKSTFMKLINSKATNQAISNAILMWRKPIEILGRRKKEAKLYTEGVYSNGGKCLVFPVNSNHRPVYSKGKVVNIGELL